VISEDDIDALVARFDKDNDGKVSVSEWKMGITVKHHLRNHRERQAGKNTAYRGETVKERARKAEVKERARKRWTGAKDLGPRYFGEVMGRKRVEQLRREEQQREQLEEQRAIERKERERAAKLCRRAAADGAASRDESALLLAVREMNDASGKAWVADGDSSNSTSTGGAGWRARQALKNKPKTYREISLEIGAIRESKAMHDQIRRRHLLHDRHKAVRITHA
jgi:hypothetical protein